MTSSDASRFPCARHGRCERGVGSQVVWAARLRVAARLGDDAVWCAPSQPIGDEHIPLGQIVVLTEAEQPSRLPLRAFRTSTQSRKKKQS